MSRGVPAWGEAAEDWLTVKRVGRRQHDPGNSDRARRTDLRRWAKAIDTVMGRQPVDSADVAATWKNVMTEIEDPDVVVRALDLLATELASSSRQRMLSTMRGFCAYLTRRGLLDHDPMLADELTVRSDPDDEVRAFTETEIDRLLAAAALPAAGRIRVGWPARDVAVISTLAYCGLRVAELCAATDAAIDRSGDHALLRLRLGTKGGRKRSVPLPHRTLANLDHYLKERNAALTDPTRLFVRHTGQPLNQQYVDRCLRQIAIKANVPGPNGAMAHGLRHSFGMRLALRGVPTSVIQDLMGHVDSKTTAIYTRAHATDLTEALDNAGLL